MIPARASLALVALLLVLRAVMAALLPLSADEAYYWLWSKHLAAGYYDHPPMIAWLIRADGSTTTVPTDPAGQYAFTGLASGSYAVQFAVPAGYTLPAQTATGYITVTVAGETTAGLGSRAIEDGRSRIGTGLGNTTLGVLEVGGGAVATAAGKTLTVVGELGSAATEGAAVTVHAVGRGVSAAWHWVWGS